jgi:hypothetical protein
MRKKATKFSMERADSKFETRNPKFETNPNVPNSKVFSWFDIFEPLDFEFVSDFDIRISDFSILQTCLVPAAPG